MNLDFLVLSYQMRSIFKNTIIILIFSAYLVPLSAEPIYLLVSPDHIDSKELCCCGNENDTCCASSCAIEESHDHEASYLIGFNTLSKYRLGPLYFRTIKQLEKGESIDPEKEETKFHFELINYNPIEKSLSGFIIPKLTSSSLIK